MQTTRVLIIGLGSIGKRHACLLQQHFHAETAALRTLLGQEPNDIGIPELRTWDEVERDEADRGRFEVALVCNPTSRHIETAIRCARRDMHLFLEKPVGADLIDLDLLLDLVRRRRLTSYVAYPLRFHPVIAALRRRLAGRRILRAGLVNASYLPDWRPNQDYRKIYSCFRERGGGVLLEMSHELDLAEYLFGPILEIDGELSRVSDLTCDADDCADLLLKHEWGTSAVHLDMFSRVPRRFIEVDTADTHLRADIRAGTLSEHDGRMEQTETLEAGADHMYVEQLRYFLDNIGRLDLSNSLERAAGLYRKMIDFREEHGFGTTDHHLRPGRVTGRQEQEHPAASR